MAVIPDWLGPRMIELVNSMAQALADDPPGRVLFNPGTTAPWDDCCDGTLWSRVISLQPVPGQVLAGGRRCIERWTATVAVGIVRCAHVIDDQGNAPSPAEMTADALSMTDDMTTLMHALSCHPLVTSLDLWQPLGVQGGCAGGEWTATITVPHCGC